MKMPISKMKMQEFKKDNARLEARLAFYGPCAPTCVIDDIQCYNAARKKSPEGPR